MTADTPQQDGEQVAKLRQNIRDMFKLESQRNDLNYALSGVERGEMTIQDYEDDLSLAIANWIVKDLLAAATAQAYEAGQRDKALAVVDARIDELHRLMHPELWALDSRAKWAAKDRIAELQAQKAKLEGENHG